LVRTSCSGKGASEGVAVSRLGQGDDGVRHGGPNVGSHDHRYRLLYGQSYTQRHSQNAVKNLGISLTNTSTKLTSQVSIQNK
jgi:hypothetical protein